MHLRPIQHPRSVFIDENLPEVTLSITHVNAGRVISYIIIIIIYIIIILVVFIINAVVLVTYIIDRFN